MVMNFWEAQRRARKKTALCLFLFIILALIAAAICEMALRTFAEDSYSPPLPLFGFLFLLVTFGVAAFQYLMYRTQGGSYVAESVGAQLIDPKLASPKERQLLNIVEEACLAAALPMPPVYVLEANEINAFAAGLTPDNAAVTVTRGCLNLLTRDELQGVVAHEIGHVSNGDMTISLRLAAMVMGFFFLLYIAMRMLQISSFRRVSDDRRGGNPIMIAALILIVAGAFTWFFGSLLKSAVSRQREYLADATSVQFTRNPQGIANALRKIAGEEVHDMPASGMAFSHMYFEDTSFLSGLFATHPPIDKRIAVLEGRE